MFKPTAFLLLAGLAAAQPPAGRVSQADVKRVAERLATLDPGAKLPFDPKQLDAIKKFLEANPKLKEEVERQVKDFKKLPPEQQQAKLDELRKTADDPQVKKQLEKALPGSTNRPPSTSKSNPPATGTPRPPVPRPDPVPQPPSPPDQDRLEKQPRPATEQGRLEGGGARQASPNLPPITAPGSKGYEKFARLWEQNVGPLKDMPAVQQLAVELFKGRTDATAAGDGGPLGDLFDPKVAGDLLKGLPEANGPRGSWSLPNIGGALDQLDRPGLPQSGVSAPELPSARVAGLAFGLLAVVAVVVVLMFLPRPTAADPRPVPGLGPWPLDPRSVETRADLVRAFEYLSVLLNGQPARAFSHEAAAAALRTAVPTAADAAEPLAALYALARYTPADHPLTADDLAAARRHLCRLAGVTPP